LQTFEVHHLPSLSQEVPSGAAVHAVLEVAGAQISQALSGGLSPAPQHLPSIAQPVSTEWVQLPARQRSEVQERPSSLQGVPLSRGVQTLVSTSGAHVVQELAGLSSPAR
jgi:hypothetical protein